MGDVDRRRPEALLDAQDLGARLHAQLGVEVRERLVHEERGRLAHDRAAERDALPLPARERLRLAVEEAVEVEDLRGLLDAALDLLLRRLQQLEAEGEVVEDGHVRIERVRLEHHRDVPVLRRDAVDDPLADLDLAVVDLLEAGEAAQRRRLAAPRWPDQDQELLVVDLEVEVVDGDDVVPADSAS